MLFLRKAHRPDRPPLGSSPLSTDHETRALTNAPPGTIITTINNNNQMLSYPVLTPNICGDHANERNIL